MKTIEELLFRCQPRFAPVVAFNPDVEKLLALDLTKDNIDVSPDILMNTGKFIAYINNKLSSHGAKFAIGGYNEDRAVYTRSSLFQDDETKEFRSLHLGIDIWGRPHTRVMTPLDGIVHSYGFNNQFGDYGATLILTHNLESVSFHTLYGHLSLNSIKNIQEGQLFKSADVIGEFGIPMENGQWPPHLHFQLVLDLGNMKGDYPGVCKISEKEGYLDNCPDPDLILQLMKYLADR